jgi:hypothetical protein
MLNGLKRRGAAKVEVSPRDFHFCFDPSTRMRTWQGGPCAGPFVSKAPTVKGAVSIISHPDRLFADQYTPGQ